MTTVFLDRDGVINRKLPEGRYVRTWEEFDYLPGVLEAIRRLTEAGRRVVIVTNQRGVARGLMTADDLEEIHARLVRDVERAGGWLDAIYYCPHEGGCICRKPAPGLLRDAARDLSFSLADAVLVGDRLSDMQAAAAVGATPILIDSAATEPAARDVAAVTVADLGSAVGWLLASANRRPEHAPLSAHTVGE